MQKAFKAEIVTQGQIVTCVAMEQVKIAYFINTQLELEGTIQAWTETKVRRYFKAARNDRQATYWVDRNTLLRFYKRA